MGKKTNNDIKAPAPAKRAAAPLTKVKPSAPAAALSATPKTVAPKLAPVAVKPAKPAAKDPAPADAKPSAEASKAVAPKRTTKATAAPVTEPAAPAATYTSDDIALRAYFIAEKRQAAGIGGDSHSDWIEAERQLAEEAGAEKKPKPKAKKA